MQKFIITITALFIALTIPVYAAPVIFTGAELPHLIGKPISSIRVLNLAGKAIPFQIDEITEAGEYVLDRGEAPNIGDGNGVFDKQDEIVFLWNDATGYDGRDADVSGLVVFTLGRGSERRAVIICADPSLPLSHRRYIDYNHTTQKVVTPYYYANFAKDRFHFVQAGVKDVNSGKFIDLTNELRVDIYLRTLFGLLPLRYTEDNIVCFVKRYKVGPIRVIRRGDFHLSLGMGVRGSRAAVNQICYPQAVQVPVRIHLPVRFRTLFSQAYIEMTPVIRNAGQNFRFTVSGENVNFTMGGAAIDTVHPVTPDGRLWMLTHGNNGFGWLLNTSMPIEHTGGSGFIVRHPPQDRTGIAECGFRLIFRDVPKGIYYITNWVIFPAGSASDIEKMGRMVGISARKVN